MKRTDTGAGLGLDILAYIEKYPGRKLNYDILATNLNTERAFVADTIRWLQREGFLSSEQPFKIHPDARAQLARVNITPRPPPDPIAAPPVLTKRMLITDEVELREYDSLAAVCRGIRGAPPESAVRRSVHAMVWQRYDAYL